MTVSCSSPYSRMETLAILACSELTKKNKLEATLKELYPDGNVPEYSVLVQTLLDRLTKNLYQVYSQDECVQQLLPKLESDSVSLEQCINIYGSGIERLESIERALSKLNYHRPPRSLVQNNWCIII